MNVRWRFGIIAGIFLAIFSLYPQIKLIYERGGEWNGHYAYNDIDEVAYGSYVAALIDGRPRKNDPYTGRDDSAESPQPESLFSIQFAAPYTIAIPAKIFGIGAPWAMTLAGAFAAFAAAMALFWLIRNIAGNDWFAMAGTLVTLAGGALFAGEGAAGEIFFGGFSYPYFPGFRRYIPAMAFPAIFLMMGLVWRLLSRTWGVPAELKKISRFPLTVLICLAFSYTVFSYFYVWTTAAAWLGCLGVVWLAVRPEGWSRDVRWLLFVGLGCAASLAPYAYLLSQRSHTMDDVQLLVKTHAPDLMRDPEILSGIVIIVILLSAAFRVMSLRDRGVLFALATAITPFVLFNQQILTGQSLQPIHYQVFIGNYIAGLSLVLTFSLLWRRIFADRPNTARTAAAAITCIAIFWGFVECRYTVRVLDDVNALRDEFYPVELRLKELGENDPDRHLTPVLDLDNATADDLPTVAPQSVLWSRHQHVFAGVTWQENKERYYQYLYYQGADPRDLNRAMRSGRDFVSVIALFGWGRHTDRLNADFKPLSFDEIDNETRLYENYIAAFDPRNAVNLPPKFLITRSDEDIDLSNVDKWFERGEGERIGRFVLYTLKLR